MVDKDIYTLLLVAFLIKHFIADFPLQTLWMATNKGTFLHPGGLVHSGIHVLGSFIVLMFALAWLNLGFIGIVMLVLLEGIIHYTIDLSKMKLDKRMACSHLVTENGCIQGRLITSGTYYLLLGFDQLLHGLTYAAMLYLVV